MLTKYFEKKTKKKPKKKEKKKADLKEAGNCVKVFWKKIFFVSFFQKNLFPKTRSARPLYNIAAGLGSLLTCFAFFIFCVLIDSLTLKEKCQEKKNVQNSFTRLQLKSIYTAYRICPTGRIFYYPKIIGKHTTIF